MTPDTCPVKTTLSLISSKWKILIIYLLHNKGTQRYGQIKQELDNVSQKVLTESLRELERNGLISRRDHHQVPPKVEYTLTDIGEDLYPLLISLADWGENYNHLKAEVSTS
ncbi:winged helix-turn-helix transcriptional regulator [Streptococcus dentasini]